MNEITENKPVNHISDLNGKVAAICEFCGKQSKFIQSDRKGEPLVWEISGWAQAPYPKNFLHSDGSTGSRYSCPACEKRLRAGESLISRSYRLNNQF